MASLILPKRGRPRIDGGTQRISLRMDVFKKWLIEKDLAGMADKTHNEFASYLLETVGQNQLNRSVPQLISVEPVQISTPVRPEVRRTLDLAQENVVLSPIVDMQSEYDTEKSVDVTGLSGYQSLNVSRIESVCTDINPEFGMHDGQLSSDSDSDASESSESTNSSELTCEEEVNKNIKFNTILNEFHGVELFSDGENDDAYDLDEESDLDETLSASEIYGYQTQGEEPMDTSDTETQSNNYIEVQYGPETVKDWINRLKRALKNNFDEANSTGKQSTLFIDHVQQDRIIVDTSLLLGLFKNNCQQPSCTGQCSVVNCTTDGGVLRVTWRCSNGHFGSWASSKVLCEKNNQKIYTNTIMIAAAIIVTGNNYEKYSLLCKFLKLHSVSRSTFMRVQRKFVIPVIELFWKEMKERIWKTFHGESVILCGDGRNDSPGHSAKYCVYVLMEQFTGVVVDLEVVDKRQTGGVSTNMEVYGLQKLLERVVGEILLSEIVTDASTAIIALVKKMKDKYPREFSHLFHSLDIWHKSVKLTKKISKAAKIKNCEVLSEWTEPIRNHFWFIAQECRGSVETLKDDWLGVLHHVVGEHEWAEGECKHGPLVATENDKTLLEKGSKAMEALQKIVTDPRFMNSLQHYVTFRHTSQLENFNSMLLKYAPKRVGFQNDSFLARTLLAAVDHNCNLFRQPDLKKNNEIKYNKVFSKRSKNWRAAVVLEEKKFDFWAPLAAEILQKRLDDKDSILKKVPLPAEHPKNISKSIAMKAIPATSVIVKQSLSRFTDANQ